MKINQIAATMSYRCGNSIEVEMMLYSIVLISLFAGVLSSRPKDNNITGCDAVQIVSREKWRSRPAIRQTTMNLPLNHVIILHTVTPFCRTKRQCIRNVQFVQDFHLDERGWWDISYNFLVGGDGRVYEGRGWTHNGAFSVNFNTNSLGLAFIGNFNNDVPTQLMIDAARNFIKCGVQRGYLTPTREIHGHRDVACTESPGNNLYTVIRQWDNYKGGRLPAYNCAPLPNPEINTDVINVGS